MDILTFEQAKQRRLEARLRERQQAEELAQREREAQTKREQHVALWFVDWLGNTEGFELPADCRVVVTQRQGNDRFDLSILGPKSNATWGSDHIGSNCVVEPSGYEYRFTPIDGREHLRWSAIAPHGERADFDLLMDALLWWRGVDDLLLEGETPSTATEVELPF